MKLLDPTLGALGIPTEVDVYKVEGWMLHPDDEVARSEICTTGAVRFVDKHRALLPDGFFRDFYSVASNATPVSMIQTSSRKPYWRGMVAGCMLHHALGSRMTGLKGDALAFAAKELSRRFGSGYSVQTNYTIWRKYKKVSHYWAAYISISSGLSSDTAPSSFPCTVDQLPGFLAAAEYFCAVGAKTKLWKSPKRTVLTRGQSVRIPSRIQLPTLVGLPQIFFFSKSL
jgi:hypothetical protein